MGSPSPATGHGGKAVKKDSPGTSGSKGAPHRRTSSVASSCLSLEFVGGEPQDGLLQSPARSTLSNGLQAGKSPAASATSSPRTPAGAGSLPSPASVKKRRSSIGCSEDLPRGLDFGGGSPAVEEKKHPFLTRGGGHKKVAIPANVTASPQTKSPGKKATQTPPGKEKPSIVGRVATASAASVLSPVRKSAEAACMNDVIRRAVLASDAAAAGASVNGSGLVAEEHQVTPKEQQVLSKEKEAQGVPKKLSPRSSLDGKIKKAFSPRSSLSKPRSEFGVVSTKGRTSSINGESAAKSDSPLVTESQKFSPGKSLDHGKNVRNSSPIAALKSKPGLTSPKGQKLAKRRQDTASPPNAARVRTRTEKPAARDEELSTRDEDETATVAEHSENLDDTDTKSLSEDILKMDAEEEGSTLMPSLMVDDANVGDEDMSSLDQPGDDPGFDNDSEMPTSWLSEDLPCMFSSLSRLPEPLDDSGSSGVFKGPFLQDGSASGPSSDGTSVLEKADTSAAAASASEMPGRSRDGDSVAASEEVCPEWNDEGEFLNLTEDSGDEFDVASRELDDQVPTLQMSLPHKFTAHSEDSVSSSFDDKDCGHVAHEDEPLPSSEVTENMAPGSAMAEDRSLPDPHVVETKQVVPTGSEHFSGGEIFHFGSSSHVQEMSAPGSMDEVLLSASHSSPEDHDQLVVSVVSDDESSEEFIGGSGSAPINLKQSFDDAAEPTIAVEFSEPHNQVDKKPPNEGTCDVAASEQVTMSDSEKPAFGTPPGECLSGMSSSREPEFDDEPHHGKFTSAYLDQDMMIFDFEEYWTHNVADDVESASQSEDAGQNDAEDLQPNISTMRGEAYEEAVAIAVEEVIENPLQESLPELPGSNSVEPEPDRQSSPKQVDSQAETEKSASLHEEYEDHEVFHLLGGSEDELRPALISQPIDEGSQERAIPNASESGPKYTTLVPEAEEHSQGVRTGQTLQSPDVPQGKDVEEVIDIAEHTSSSVKSVSEHGSSRSEPLPLEEEDLDPAPILLGNGLDGIQHSDGDEAGDSDEVHDSPSSTQAGTQKSAFENPSVPDADIAEQSEGVSNLPGQEVGHEIRAETDRDIADATITSHSSSEPDVASPISKVDAAESSDIDEEGDQNKMCISGAKEAEVPSATNYAQATALTPPVNDISEEEQTQERFLSSLGCNEESSDNEDSPPAHELQISNEPVEEKLQCRSAMGSHEESAAEHDHLPTPSGAMLLLPVEEPGPHESLQKAIATPDVTLVPEDEPPANEQLTSTPEVNATEYLDDSESADDEKKSEILVAGSTKDLHSEEVGAVESGEPLCTIQTHGEASENPTSQERHLLLETSLPSDDQVSKTEATEETEKALAASFDEDMPAVARGECASKNMEVLPDHSCSQDEPLEQVFVASTPEAATLGVEETKEDLTQTPDKEREELEGVHVVQAQEDSSQLVHSPTKSLILGHLPGSLLTAENTEDITESEADNEARGKAFNESSTVETQVLEDDEDTVVLSLENPVAAASAQVDTPDATISATENPKNARSDVLGMAGKEEEESSNDIIEGESQFPSSKRNAKDEEAFDGYLDDEESQVPSQESWRTAKEEDTSNENLGVESQLPSSISWSAKEEEVLHGTLDEEETPNPSDAAERNTKEEKVLRESPEEESQNPSTVSWRSAKEEEVVNEESLPEDEEDKLLVVKEKHLLEHEDLLVENTPEKSAQETAILHVGRQEDHSNSSWTAGQGDESLNANRSLGKDSVSEDEQLTSQFKATDTTIWEENDDQNHSSDVISWPRPVQDEESFNGSLKDEESSPEVVEKVVELISAPSHLQEEPLLEVVDNSRKGLIVAPELLNSNTSSLGTAEELERRPAWKTEKEGQNRSGEEVETVTKISFEESIVDLGDDNTDLETEKTDMEEPELTSNRNPEEKSTFEEESVERVSDAGNVLEHSGASDAEVFTRSTGKEGERLLNGTDIPREETSLEAQDHAVVTSSSNCNAKNDNGATTLQSSDGRSGTHVEENSAMASKPKPEEGAVAAPSDNASGNLKIQEPVFLSEANGATTVQISDETRGARVEENSAMASKPKPDEGAVAAPHENSSEIDQFVDAAEDSNSLLVQTNHVVAVMDTPASDKVVTKAAAVSNEESSSIPTSNETPEHETKLDSQAGATTTSTATATVSAPATATGLEEVTTEEEPQSPTAILYPSASLSEPPFSGSQQDRLWEEQAEAYNSGQGTPSHATTQTAPVAPSCIDEKSPSPGKPELQPPSSPDDQIQPAAATSSGASNGHATNGHATNGHATNGAAANGARSGASVAGETTITGSSSAAQESNVTPVKTGKESTKQHTPLRSLLLEDARNGNNKGSFEPGGAGDGVTSSPSFIRRLFRVMSTPSRNGGGSNSDGRDDGQSSKLKSKSWVSCLGSPQVQQ